MSLAASSTYTASMAAGSAIFSASAGDPWCPTHGWGFCPCYGSSEYTDLNSYSIYATYTCPMCSQICTIGTYHVCTTVMPNTYPGTNPAPPFIPTLVFPALECAICDKVLEPHEKKLCSDCRGVFEAWKFLTKKEPEPEDKG